MRRAWYGLALAAALALALPAAALAVSGKLVFRSTRCDFGGQTSFGPGPPGTTNPANCGWSVFTVGADGGGLRRLTTEGNQAQDFAATWTPDGKIVYQHEGQSSDDVGFRIMNSDGSGDQPFSLGVPHSDSMYYVTWSPDGQRVAFAVAEQWHATSEGVVKTDEGGTFTMNRDGSDLRNVMPDDMDVSEPAFTGDGRHVVVYGHHGSLSPSEPQQSDYGAWIVGTDGSGFGPLTIGTLKGTLPWKTAFSPDGPYLAVAETNPLWDLPRLYSMRIDGSDVRLRSLFGGTDPSWSPDDTLFFSGPAAEGRGYVLWRAQGSAGAPVPITTAPARDVEPRWSGPDAGVVNTGHDHEPPAIVFHPPSELQGAGARGHAKTAMSARPLPFFVADRTGIRKVEAAVDRRAGSLCRFLKDKRSFGPRARCGHPSWFRVKGPAALGKRLAALPHGRYGIRLRATDVHGNRTAHPRRRAVKLG